MSTSSDLEVTTARMKSYTGNAVLTFILYWFFWLPGLIVNYMFYSEAKRMERTAGQSLPGVGCLSIMLFLNAIVLVLGLLLICIMLVGLMASGA
jgi:CDP-diglyceride synthetase